MTAVHVNDTPVFPRLHAHANEPSVWVLTACALPLIKFRETSLLLEY